MLWNKWHLTAKEPPEVFLRSVASGWTGLLSAVLVVYVAFLSTYIRRLNHLNLHVKDSTCHALLQAMMQHHNDIPCLPHDFLRVCPTHGDDHVHFLL